MVVSAEVTWCPVALVCEQSSSITGSSLLYTFKQGGKTFDHIGMVERVDPGEKVLRSTQLPTQQ